MYFIFHMDNYKLIPLNYDQKDQFLKFTNQFIGENYFNEKNFEKQIELSTKNNLNCSFVLTNKQAEIIGIRLTYAPANWIDQVKTKYIKNESINLDTIAYFKSLFIDPNYQQKGLGPLLSNESIKILKNMGATHILSHSWKESPNNSSVRYLKKWGFEPIGEISNYWIDVDYLCTGCNLSNCTCTSVEMLYTIKD